MENDAVKESAYNLSIRDEGGRYYLFNTRRGAAHLMESHAYQSYWASANGAAPLEDAAEMVRQLIDGGFLVDNDADELSEIESAHVDGRRSREKLELVIAPSMACNLDCFYCFETNRYPGRMGDETQRNLVGLARRYLESGTKRLAVTWYGGEPLLAFRAIERLSKAFLALCDEAGCTYTADIVTNGTLLTPERAQRLASWKVARAQITLDGVPDLHDQRRVPKAGTPTFDKVVKGIEAAVPHMHVAIRINVCRDVAIRLEDLLRILASRGLNAKASVYLAPLRGLPELSGTHESIPMESTQWASGKERGQRIEFLTARETGELMLHFHGLLRKYGFATYPDVLPHPRKTICMGDRDHSWLIEANGNVQKCYWTAGAKHEAVGHLTSGGIVSDTPLRKWQDWSAFKRPDCASCVMLPLCLGLCPLRQMQGEADCCPTFKHNWDRVLAYAFGLVAEQVTPVHLALAGSRLRDLSTRDLR